MSKGQPILAKDYRPQFEARVELRNEAFREYIKGFESRYTDEELCQMEWIWGVSQSQTNKICLALHKAIVNIEVSDDNV